MLTLLGWAFSGPLTDGSVSLKSVMKLGRVIPYLKKIQKVHESLDAPPGFC